MRYVLASTSPYRRQLLKDFGLEVAAVAPKVDEEALKDGSLTPIELCKMLARAKAESIACEHPGDFVMGADQVVDLDGEVLGKGGSPEKATAQLLRLQGRKHHLITCLCVFYGGRVYQHTDLTTLEMRRLTPTQAQAYVLHDRAWDCAGSYKLERAGRALFRSIQTQDASAIIGLPLMALTDILVDAGLNPPCFEISKEVPT